MPQRSEKRGQAMVEMALVLPVFLLVICGLVDFSRALHSWACLNQMCVEGVRVAARRTHLLIAHDQFQGNTHAEVEKATEAFWRFLSPAMKRTQVSGPVIQGVGPSQRKVSVSASYQINLITPLIPSLVGKSWITVHAKADQQKE